jgi:hypothetical protein
MNQEKFNQLLKVSNPEEVDERAELYYGRPTYLSTRKYKKYMIQDDRGKWHHFGDIRYSDFTYHKDEERRNYFRNRNRRWENADKFSPAYMSYHLLW